MIKEFLCVYFILIYVGKVFTLNNALMHIYSFEIFQLDNCPAGEFWNVTECSLCAKHFYQNVTGKDYCFSCPLGKLTTGQGSINSSQCYCKCLQLHATKELFSCSPKLHYHTFFSSSSYQVNNHFTK